MSAAPQETLSLFSPLYWMFLTALIFGRGMDFLSTWLATPQLVLEGNPIARWLGWKWGILVNLMVSVGFACLPLPAVIITTTSLLVAARNFQSAWMMRAVGEEAYRDWYITRLMDCPPAIFLASLAGQTVLVAIVGGVLVLFSRWELIPMGVGVGMLAYAFAVLVYSLLAYVRTRRALRSH